jgi:hypothetical protein
MTISRRIRLRMRNVLDQICRENENTHFLFRNFFRKSYRLWDNVENYGWARGTTNDVTIWHILVACWISKATYTHAHAHARMRTHTNMEYLLFFHSKNNSRIPLNVTRTHTICPVLHNFCSCICPSYPVVRKNRCLENFDLLHYSGLDYFILNNLIMIYKMTMRRFYRVVSWFQHFRFLECRLV